VGNVAVSQGDYDDDEQDRDNVEIGLSLVSGGKSFKVQVTFHVETPTGYWPNNAREHSSELLEFSEMGQRYHFVKMGPTEKLAELFSKIPGLKVTFVATLVIEMEENRGLLRTTTEADDDFMTDMRSMSVIDHLKDFTVICKKKPFPCNKLVLSARSKFFRALFFHEKDKMETTIDDSPPEMVESVLKFMSDGLIPEDLDEIAMDLIPVADMYGPEHLTKVCAKSIMNSLSPDNAVEALILIDRHQKKLRPEVLEFIKKEAVKVVNSNDWHKFVRDFPALVKDIILAMAETKPAI